jgi:hypothetical protein
MNRAATIVSCLLIAGLAGVSFWQWRTISDLEERVHEAESNAAKHLNSPVPVRTAPASAPRDTGRSETAGPVGGTAKKSPAKGSGAAPKTALPAPSPEIPGTTPAINQQEALTPERKLALLQGRETFNPGPIDESSLPVTEKTPLSKGQALQISYAGTWYAGEVIGFEKDGGVHVRYFGWESSWDEIVPRSDLRLDPQAREHAVDKYGARAATGAF